MTFDPPTLVTAIAFKEMELYGNWGSWGIARADGVDIPGFGFGRDPHNDRLPDSSYREHRAEVGSIVTTLSLHVEDTTSSSMIVLDDLTVDGR